MFFNPYVQLWRYLLFTAICLSIWVVHSVNGRYCLEYSIQTYQSNYNPYDYQSNYPSLKSQQLILSAMLVILIPSCLVPLISRFEKYLSQISYQQITQKKSVINLIWWQCIFISLSFIWFNLHISLIGRITPNFHMIAGLVN